MATEIKRVLYIFITLCVILTFALAVSRFTGSSDNDSTVSESLSDDRSQNASQVIAEQSEETTDQSLVSGEESNEYSGGESSTSSEESQPEESSEEDESSEEQSTAEGFPVNYIENNVTASYIAVYNVTEGRYIYGKNQNEKCYPASLTKLVTALLAVKYLDENEIITVGEEIKRIGRGSSVACLGVGYKMKLEVLLDAMMLPSGNDAAYTAAVAVGRKVLNNPNASVDDALDSFYAIANEYVKSIGCTGTNIACPDGYHDDNHYTTAWDYVLISKEALKSPLISKVVKKKTASDTLADGAGVTYTNNNRLITDTEYRSYWGIVTGLKTGTTDEAGYCIAVSAKYNGVEMIIIVMKSSTASSRYDDAVKLISAAYGWFE